MNRLLITLIFAFPLFVFADTVPIKERPSLPFDNSSHDLSSISSSKSNIDPAGGHDNLGVLKMKINKILNVSYSSILL